MMEGKVIGEKETFLGQFKRKWCWRRISKKVVQRTLEKQNKERSRKIQSMKITSISAVTGALGTDPKISKPQQKRKYSFCENKDETMNHLTSKCKQNGLERMQE